MVMQITPLLFTVLLGTVSLGMAEIEEEYPLGIEVVTGLRTDYLYRGFHQAGTVLDVQVEGEIPLGEEFILTLGGWTASELSDDFSEIGGSLDLRRAIGDKAQVGGAFAYLNREEGPLDDGQDLSLYFDYFPSQDWAFKALTSRDFESEGWYVAFEGAWSRRINDDTFLSLSSGLSWVDSYYERDGLNDLYGRASVTYVVNGSVSITPFAGWSYLLDSDDPGKDRIFAGLWFEVVF
jgi:hypothetical protein